MCACTESDVRESATRLHSKRPIRFTLARAHAFISANDSFCYRQLQQRYVRNVPAPRSLTGFLLCWTHCITWYYCASSFRMYAHTSLTLISYCGIRAVFLSGVALPNRACFPCIITVRIRILCESVSFQICNAAGHHGWGEQQQAPSWKGFMQRT
jgi:hypothetical protein